jgi:hypothetical protein
MRIGTLFQFIFLDPELVFKVQLFYTKHSFRTEATGGNFGERKIYLITSLQTYPLTSPPRPPDTTDEGLISCTVGNYI